MADDNLAARFARAIRDLLVSPPVVSNFDEAPDPKIVRTEWANADCAWMNALESILFDNEAYRPARYLTIFHPAVTNPI